MTTKDYSAPELLVTPVFTVAGFAQSGTTYSGTEGTETLIYDGVYMTL